MLPPSSNETPPALPWAFRRLFRICLSIAKETVADDRPATSGDVEAGESVPATLDRHNVTDCRYPVDHDGQVA